MKKLVFACLAMLFTQYLLAQRVDLDRFNFTAVFRNFPDDPLPDAYRTYNVRVEAAPSLLAGFGLEQAVNIEGLRKVPGTGHITILAMLDDLIIDHTETRERIETKKDKQGQELKIPHYSTAFTYSFGARASIYDYKGQTILSNYVLFDRSRQQQYQTAEFGSAQEATNFFTNKSAEIRQNLARQMVANALSNLNQLVNAKYGYGVQRVNDILWVLNNRRHPEYMAAQKAWNTFREAIVKMDPDQPLDEVKKDMQPVIAYFEQIKKKYPGGKKDDRKMRYAAYFNLSKIYLYLDEPEKAMQEADALSMNDFDERDGKYLRAAAEQLQSILRRNNAETRHFALHIDEYAAPVN